MVAFNYVSIIVVLAINIISLGLLKYKFKEYKFNKYYFPVTILISKYINTLKLTNTDNEKKMYKVCLTDSKKEGYSEYFQKYMSLLIIIFLFINIVCLSIANSSNESKIKDDYYVKRPNYGEGSNNLEVDVRLEDGTTENITIEVEPVELGEEERNKLFKDVEKYVYNNFLNENTSSDCIVSKLNFVESYPADYNVEIAWEPENTSIIDYDGNITHPKEDTESSINFIINYFDYSEEHDIEVTILSDEKANLITNNTLSSENVNEKIKQNVQDKDEYLVLPKEIDGMDISYIENNEKIANWRLVMILGIISMAIMFIYRNNELDRRLEKRNEELLLDYSEVVSKFAIMINSGMNLRKAWEKICVSYSVNECKKKRYVYEEMLITLNEMRSGKSEENAYADFGKRIGLIPYIKLTTMFIQSIKRGNENLVNDIELESIGMLKERTELIKQRAAKIGNYLVFPMVILLALTIIIVVLPAIMNI